MLPMPWRFLGTSHARDAGVLPARQEASAAAAVICGRGKGSNRSGRVLCFLSVLVVLKLSSSFWAAPVLWISPSLGCGSWTPQSARSGERGSGLQALGSAGNFLFDMSGYSKERFVVGTTMDLMEEIPRLPEGPTCLEFGPEDGRGIRYLKPVNGAVGEYIAVAAQWDDQRRAVFQASTFDKVDLRFYSWTGAAPLKEVRTQSVDIVLFQSGSESQLGAKAYSNAFKESARVLKPKGQIWVFREASEKRPLPPAAEKYFAVNKTLGGEEVGMVCSQMVLKPQDEIPKAAKRPVSSSAAAKAVRKPGARSSQSKSRSPRRK